MSLKQLPYFFLLLLLPLPLFGQSLEKIAKLEEELSEISGLEFLNDSVFVAHNDSGNEPLLYFLDLKGKIFHRVRVSNARNVDWEDITTDGKGTLYIADIGNNTNRRQDLTVYIVSDKNILSKQEVEARKISFSYADQQAFPPENKTDWHFDAESLGFYRDSLVIFTKSQTQPYDGLTTCYKMPAKAGNYSLKPQQKIQLRDRGHKLDAVTSVTFRKDRCYLLTYSSVEIFRVKENGQVDHEKRISFLVPTQKESICVNPAYLYIADEYNKKVGGRNLYQIKLE